MWMFGEKGKERGQRLNIWVGFIAKGFREAKPFVFQTMKGHEASTNELATKMGDIKQKVENRANSFGTVFVFHCGAASGRAARVV